MEVASIYTQFHNALLSFIRGKINSQADAEDILQNVFIKISSNIDTLKDDEKLKSWIYAITRNAIIDHYRTNAGNKNLYINENFDLDILNEEDVDTTKGLDHCVGSMIGLLPDEYRDIIIDSELKQISQKELAEKYKMAYPSMRSRVQRGRERLKQLFYNCCHIETDTRGNILSAQGKSNCGDPCDSCE